MRSDRIFVLSLSGMEVEWILHQLATPETRLLPSLCGGLSGQELREKFVEARSSLESRGWIKRQPDDQLALDVTVAGVVGALGFSRSGLFATQFREQDLQPRVYRYFSAEGLIVEQYQEKAKEEITLTALRDLRILRKRLYEYLGLQDQDALAEETFRCGEEAFADVPYVLAGDGRPAATARLVEMGAEEDLAADLTRAMEYPVRQTTLQAVELDPDHKDGIRLRENLTVLEGTCGLWVLNTCLRDQPVGIEILPCDADQVRGLVDQMLELLSW